jgi:hypothetical protein
MLAKEAKVHVNICDWDLKIHHVVWVYNTTYKTTTWYSPFRLIYGMEALLPIELEVMILRIATTMRLPLDESQHHRVLQFNELDELQLKTYQSIEVAHAQQNKAFDKKVIKKEFKEGDLVTMFDTRHHCRNCYPSGLDLLLSRKCLLIMGLMNLKMLMAHHIQTALIMTN